MTKLRTVIIWTAAAILCRLGSTSFAAYPMPFFGSAHASAQTLSSVPANVPSAAVPGNAVRLLIDGPAAFEAMFAAIERARRSIDLQTYIFEADGLSQRISELLVNKRAQGIEVNVLYDSVGSANTPPEVFQKLTDAGVHVCEFNPVNPAKSLSLSLNNRGHRKILVIDSEVAFTGGINISKVYSSGSSSPRREAKRSDDRQQEGWRDTQVEVRGPAAAEFQRLFADSWQQQRCPAARALHARESTRRGETRVQVIGSSPKDQANPIYQELLSAIRTARKSIYITMAYFVPDKQTLALLGDAARRGVDVQLILPGFSDSTVVLNAGRSYYATLLEAGVRIHERQDALLHAKTAVVDGAWSMIGSTNMDWRSFVHNDEVSAIILDPEFGSRMTKMFTDDLGKSIEIDRQAWSSRDGIARAKELWARLWAYWL